MHLLVQGFEWDPDNQPNGNVQHIARHNIVPEEVEEVFEHPGEVLVRRTRQGYRLAYGRTATGRHLLIVFVLVRKSIVRIVTARDMDQAEQRLYRRYFYQA